MIDLNQTTIQQLKDAIALVEMAKAAGISVESAPSANPKGEAVKSIVIGDTFISKENLCGLVWYGEGLDVYCKGNSNLDREYTEDPDIQSALFNIAGYRPYNPWKDGE